MFRWIFIASIFLITPASSSEILGKFVDREGAVPEIMKVCDEDLDDRLVTITRKSIDYVENRCKILKTKQWSGQAIWDYKVKCSGSGVENLIISDEGQDIRIQHREGPLSKTTGSVYRKCPSAKDTGPSHVGSASNVEPPDGFPSGRYYFKTDGNQNSSPQSLCKNNVNETDGRIDFGRRQVDFRDGNCRIEEIARIPGKAKSFEFNAFCTSKHNKSITPRRFQFRVSERQVESIDLTDTNSFRVAYYYKCH